MNYTFRGIALDDDIRESIDRYVQHGIPTGGFLEACIENDLHGALGRADEQSLAQLPAIIGYLVNECPAKCWGEPGAFRNWIKWVKTLKESLANEK
jgi:hypothetical protein